LKATRFLAVLGSSGTGKSSLVKTGLLSALDIESATGSPWRVIEFRPGGDPLGKLAEGLLRSERSEAEKSPENSEIESLKARFKLEGPRELINWRRKCHFTEGAKLLLLVDQFEELFRYQNSDQREEAQAFVSLLLESRWPRGVASPAQAPIPIYVAITMRSEYLGACALMLGLPEAINEGIYLAPRMNREQCEEAIVGPALVSGIEIEDRLVTKLLNDMAEFAPWEEQQEGKDRLSRLARQADQLPLMQYALNQMWGRAVKARSKRSMLGASEKISLKLSDYLGLERELDAHGDEVYGRLSESAKAVAMTVFRAVTSGTAVSNAERWPTKYGELTKICGEGRNDSLAEVIAAFGPHGCQFLACEVRGPSQQISSSTWIDITHESLIRQWKALSRWVENEGKASHAWRRLRDDAERGGYLYGRRLKDAVELRDEVKPTPHWADRYGGAFEEVNRLITSSQRVKYGLVLVGLVVFAGLLSVGTFAYQQHAEKVRGASIATQNFELAVNFAQTLLNNLSEAVQHGDIRVEGANRLLGMAKDIVGQVKIVESSIKTNKLLIKLQYTASDINGELGNYTAAYDEAKIGRELAEALERDEPNDLELLRLNWTGAWRMGDAISYLGGKESARKALAEYQTAETLVRALVERSPKSKQYQQDLMFTLLKVADSRKDLGDVETAIADYRRALMLVQDLAANERENTKLQRDMANARRRVGQALSEKGDFGGALEQLRAALDILTDLAQADPNDDGVTSNLAANYRDIAAVYMQWERFDPALDAYSDALRIQEGLITKDPANATWQFSLASFSSAIGDVLVRQNRLDDAVARYRIAHRVRKDLALKDPTNLSAQRRLATAAILLADVLKAQNMNLDEAEGLYRSAIEGLDELRPRYDLDVFNCYVKIGDIFLKRQELERASTEYKRAQGIARERAGSGTSGEWQKNLKVAEVKDLLASQKRANWTFESYNDVLRVLAELAAQQPKNLEWSVWTEKLKAEMQDSQPKP
jgi:tetratricopeptide (TPR) repeat protein